VVKRPSAAPERSAAAVAGDDARWRALVQRCGNKAARVTPFQRRVYLLCACIPRGRVSTYGALARALHSAPRAVGQALRRNPFAPTVPCHRVVASSLDIGGFSGETGPGNPTVLKKIALLRAEGVDVTAERVAEACCLHDASALVKRGTEAA